MLLFTSIGIAWLAGTTLLVAICRSAADRERGRATAELASVSIGPKLVLSKSSEHARRVRRRAAGAHGSAGESRRSTRRLQIGHGVH